LKYVTEMNFRDLIGLKWPWTRPLDPKTWSFQAHAQCTICVNL